MSVYMDAMEKWGRELQTVICMEECAELIQELSKRIRHPDMEPGNLVSEIADVSICLESILEMYDIPKSLFESHKKQKIERLKLRIIEAT